VTPHWASLSSRNVPAPLLGRYFGWAFAASGLCTVFTGVWAARLAAAGGTRWGYAACFGLAFVIQLASLLLLAATRPLAPAPDPAPPLRAFLAERWREARRSRVLKLFGALMVLLAFGGAATQLFAVFLRDHGFGDLSFEAFNPALSVGGMLGSVSLGWLMDKRGPSAALRGCLVALCCALALLLLAPTALWPASAAMACAGLFNAAFGSVMLPWMLRLSSKGQVPAFSGLYGTLTAPWNFFAPMILGRVAQSHGYGAAFSVSAAAAMAALLALALVPVGKEIRS
jgi:predicted MFS family arabinose efflux permease